jgi:hypothetical protein
MASAAERSGSATAAGELSFAEAEEQGGTHCFRKLKGWRLLAEASWLGGMHMAGGRKGV